MLLFLSLVRERVLFILRFNYNFFTKCIRNKIEINYTIDRYLHFFITYCVFYFNFIYVYSIWNIFIYLRTLICSLNDLYGKLIYLESMLSPTRVLCSNVPISILLMVLFDSVSKRDNCFIFIFTTQRQIFNKIKV